MLNAAGKTETTSDGLECKSRTQSKNYINKLDQLINRNKNKYKLNSLDLINHIDNKNGTPVTIASIYDPMDQSRIIREDLVVLIDSGASHSMAKASLVMKYKKSHFKRSEASYRTAAGIVQSKYSMKLTITLDEFGRNIKINHTFNLDKRALDTI